MRLTIPSIAQARRDGWLDATAARHLAKFCLEANLAEPFRGLGNRARRRRIALAARRHPFPPTP